MKKKIFKALIVLVVVVLLLTGCSNPVSGSSRRRSEDTILKQWQAVESNFQDILKALNDGSEGYVELRVINLDDKGYLKKYEFVGFKDGKQFLVYDENGELKD